VCGHHLGLRGYYGDGAMCKKCLKREQRKNNWLRDEMKKRLAQVA
jgi:hypothetical protein